MKRTKSAGGLKVKALGWTPRDAGSRLARRSSFPASKICSKEKNYYLFNR